MSREQCSIEICENLQNASLIIRGAQWLQRKHFFYSSIQIFFIQIL